MKAVTSTVFSLWPCHSSLMLPIAVTTSDTQKRRIKPNARVARRRILLASAILWTLPFQQTPGLNASNRKRRKHERRSAKTSLAPFQRHKLRKRSVVQKKRPRRKKRQRRSVCCAMYSVLTLPTVCLGCEGRGKESEGRGRKRCEESTACCESRGRYC